MLAVDNHTHCFLLYAHYTETTTTTSRSSTGSTTGCICPNTTTPTHCPVCPTTTVSSTSCPSPPPCTTTTTTKTTTTTGLIAFVSKSLLQLKHKCFDTCVSVKKTLFPCKDSRISTHFFKICWFPCDFCEYAFVYNTELETSSSETSTTTGGIQNHDVSACLGTLSVCRVVTVQNNERAFDGKCVLFQFSPTAR